MSSMLNLYKETSIDLEPPSPKTVVAISIPASDASANWRALSLRSSPSDDVAFKDENSFAEHCLATQGSIYFRDPKRAPRSFLWRVLDEDKVLEIRCVDLTRSGHENVPDAYLTLRLEFRDQILPHCVGLADPPDHDVLNVFLLTTSKTLYTLTIRPDFFRRPGASANVKDWCKTYETPLFGSPIPHRLHASSAFEVYFSLDDGSLVRLRRKSGEDGSRWEPTTYSDGAWTNSIRGLVKWQGQQTVQYNGRGIDLTTATAIASASDQTYVYTVCLNHTLKAWNLANRKLNVTKDLLNRPRNVQEASLIQLSPAESCFIRTFNAERTTGREGDRHYLITFSPHEDGQFKFWSVRDGLTSPLQITDMYPKEKFSPPDPDPIGNTIWNLADFDLKTTEDGYGMELLVLWKNNTASKLNILTFDLLHLPRDWVHNWAGTTNETRFELDLATTLNSDPVEATEAWLRYFFHPGRFSTEALETSLSIYQDALRSNSKGRVHKSDKSLKERICSAVASTVSLWRHSECGMDYERFSADTDSQWRQFWRIVEDINKRRKEPLSLIYDRFSDMPWIVQSGGCSAIRECSDTELLFQNNEKAVTELEQIKQHRLSDRKPGKYVKGMASLLQVAGSFRKQFPIGLAQSCATALDSQLFEEPTLGPAAQLMLFYETANFGEYVNDDLYDTLTSGIDGMGGFSKLSRKLFYQIIETFPQSYRGEESHLISTPFGAHAMAAGAEETVSIGWQVMFDLLLLVVFVEVEIHQDGEQMKDFDGASLFTLLLDQLREYEVMKWLASNTREVSWDPEPSIKKTRRQSLANDTDTTVRKVSSLMEDPWAKDVRPLAPSKHPQSYTFTHNVRELVALMTRSGEVTLDDAIVYIECDMIRNGNIDLASEFLRFLPNTPWSTYVKGRLYLARSEFPVAAICFQKAAFLLAHGRAQAGDLTEMSSGLLDIIEADYFNNGLAKYHQHVLSLFEKAGAFTQVGEFARLALSYLPSDSESSDSRDSDPRADILSRLFNSSVETTSWDSAYFALSSFTNGALRKSSLQKLITKMLTSSPPSTSHLLRLPFGTDPRMAAEVDTILSSLAARSTSTATSMNFSTVPSFYQVLYSFRIAQSNFRGAAAALFSRLQLLRKSSIAINDPESKAIRNDLLALINVLACVNSDEAYILAEIDESDPKQKGARHARTSGNTGKSKGKRRIVTIGDLRKEYQDVLDRVSDIESGKFEFALVTGGNDEEDEDERMDMSFS